MLWRHQLWRHRLTSGVNIHITIIRMTISTCVQSLVKISAKYAKLFVNERIWTLISPVWTLVYDISLHKLTGVRRLSRCTVLFYWTLFYLSNYSISILKILKSVLWLKKCTTPSFRLPVWQPSTNVGNGANVRIYTVKKCEKIAE